MNIADMLAKTDVKTLQAGLKNLSSMLSPEQMKQAEHILNNLDSGDVAAKLKNLDINGIQKELSNNPTLLRELQKDPETMKKIGQIIGR